MIIDKKELLRWYEKYNQEEDQYNTSLELELGNKLRATKELTKEELIKIIEWKFQGRLLGRRKRILNLIKNIEDFEIRKLSKLSFNEQNEKKRIEYLREIKGVGIALASCILTFYDPKSYGVYDIHIWRELFGREPKDLFVKIEYYIKVLEKLREISNGNNIDVRIVEKALFKKNYDESKIQHQKT